jgi:hypothetical protein
LDSAGNWSKLAYDGKGEMQRFYVELEVNSFLKTFRFHCKERNSFALVARNMSENMESNTIDKDDKFNSENTGSIESVSYGSFISMNL